MIFNHDFSVISVCVGGCFFVRRTLDQKLAGLDYRYKESSEARNRRLINYLCGGGVSRESLIPSIPLNSHRG